MKSMGASISLLRHRKKTYFFHYFLISQDILIQQSKNLISAITTKLQKSVKANVCKGSLPNLAFNIREFK